MNKKLLFSVLLAAVALSGCMPDDPDQDFNAFVAQDKQKAQIDCEQLALNGTPYPKHGLAADYLAHLEEEHHYRFAQCRSMIEAQRQDVCESKAQELGLPNKAGLTFPYRYLVALDTACITDLQHRLAQNETPYNVIAGAEGKPSFLAIGAHGESLYNLTQLVHVEVTDGSSRNLDLKYFTVDAQFVPASKGQPSGDLHATFADEQHARRFVAALTQQTSANRAH